MIEKSKISEGWVETTLGDVMRISSGKARPKTFGKYPVYGGNGILDYANEFNFDNETIIVGRVGAYCGCVYYENGKFWLSDNALGIKSNEKSDIKFLYYYLININLNKKSIGGAQPLLTQGILNQIEIIIPQDIDEQKSIAAILTSFDDKIELLQAQNKTLEELAQTVFKEWFGKYKVGDKLPEGWRVGVIEDLTLKMNSGGTPSTKEESYYNGYINWFSTKELQDNFIFESDKKITEEGLNNSSTKLFPKDTVIMAIYAAPTVGRLGILNQESAFNQAAVGLIAKNKVGYPFVFLLLKYFRDEFNNLSNGAAQQNLNVGIVKNFKICIPNEESLNFFNKIQMPLFEKIRANSIQIQTLTKTRDELLPKLMSGEIRVKNVRL